MSITEQLSALEEHALELMNEHQVPGVSLGLILDGTEHYISLGVTSVLRPLPVTPDTLFRSAAPPKPSLPRLP